MTEDRNNLWYDKTSKDDKKVCNKLESECSCNLKNLELKKHNMKPKAKFFFNLAWWARIGKDVLSYWQEYRIVPSSRIVEQQSSKTDQSHTFPVTYITSNNTLKVAICNSIIIELRSYLTPCKDDNDWRLPQSSEVSQYTFKRKLLSSIYRK